VEDKKEEAKDKKEKDRQVLEKNRPVNIDMWQRFHDCDIQERAY